MARFLTIKQRLLVSHLLPVVLVAGALGAYLYYAASLQVIEGLRARVLGNAVLIGQDLDAALLDSNASNPDPRHLALAAQLRSLAAISADLGEVSIVRRDGALVQRIASASPVSAALANVPSAEEDPTERSLIERGFEQPVASDTSRFSLQAQRIVAYAPVAHERGRYAVAVEMDAAQVSERLSILRLSTWLALLICVLTALVLSRMAAGRLLTRIRDMVARCRAFAEGAPLPTVANPRADELDDLAIEFDAMAQRLRISGESREQAYAALREANDKLESRVRHRTRELEGATHKLRGEIESRMHIEALLAEAALTDALTGLLNRRAIMEMLSQAASGLKPGDVGISIILADVDHFKRINDQHGHGVGDQVLSAVGRLLKDNQGEQHFAARWGGEEFLLIWPGVRLATACKRAEELRMQVNEMHIGILGLRATLSLGVAEFQPGEELDECLRRCDAALYKAKAAGRNTVVAAQGALFATMS